MSTTTLTNFDALLKELYIPQDVVLRMYKQSKLLALLPKFQDFQGREMPIPIEYEGGQGISATFSVAQSNASASQSKAFLLKRKKSYGVGRLDNELMLATQAGGRDGKAAFKKAVGEINNLQRVIGLELGFKLFRGQSNARGRFSAYTADSPVVGQSTLTLNVRGDIVGIFNGMKLVAALNETGALRAATTYTVVSVNRRAGTFVVTGTPVATSGWDPGSAGTGSTVHGTAGDFLFRAGDHVVATDNLGISGFDDWMPATLPGSDSFYGVDRSADRDRLAGIIVDGSAYTTITEVLIDAAMYAREQNQEPQVCLLHPAQLSRVIKERDGKVMYDKMGAGPGSPAGFGFEVIRLDTPAGPVKLVDDHCCPMNRAYMIQPGTWKLCSIGETPRMLTYGEGEGLKWLRLTDEDSVEFRFGSYLNLGCHFPGANVTILLPPAS